ncbi:glycosyltransferase [Nonomuraea sp. B12E4]|uniref:glycosyltransferase n=1 Tax=Nonomuraea sp. B12E4 TaxID=3153564 RepID=UPI00325E9820
MRVLCTVTGSMSHARAMLPLVSALAEAGHEVLVAAPELPAPMLSGPAVTVAPIMGDPAGHTPLTPCPIDELWFKIFMGPLLMADFAALMPLARDFRPDLIVRDGGELAGRLVAEALGVPLVVAPSGAANHINPAILLPVLNERRARLGLPRATEPYAVNGFGRLDCMPPEYSFDAYPAKRTLLYRQPAVVDPSESCLEEWAGDLRTGRPLVLASVGTVLPHLPHLPPPRPDGATPDRLFQTVELLDAIITGLSRLDCHALVATGGLPVQAPPPGSDVRVVARFPQPTLLPYARLFVTHGGYNSVREAVAAGVPMAVLPRFGDQPRNAERIRRLGLGDRLPGDDPATISATCRRLLGDSRTIAQALNARQRMLALPPVETIVTDLEQAARSGATS